MWLYVNVTEYGSCVSAEYTKACNSECKNARKYKSLMGGIVFMVSSCTNVSIWACMHMCGCLWWVRSCVNVWMWRGKSNSINVLWMKLRVYMTETSRGKSICICVYSVCNCVGMWGLRMILSSVWMWEWKCDRECVRRKHTGISGVRIWE